MEKGFLDGISAGAKALKVGAPDDIGVSAQKVAIAVEKGAGVRKNAKEAFGSKEKVADTLNIEEQVYDSENGAPFTIRDKNGNINQTTKEEKTSGNQ